MERLRAATALAATAARLVAVPPWKWTLDDVCAWLETLDLSHLAGNFRKHQLDGEAFANLSLGDFDQLEVAILGDRIRLQLRHKELLSRFARPTAVA